MQDTPRPPSRWTPTVVRTAAESADLAGAAAAYASAGIPVFPCVPHAKSPLTRRGFLDASTDELRVSRWWARWPEANIGIPTGAASGIDVVDVDVHPGGSGYGGLARARAAGLATRWAWLVRTPSGGLHAYFLRAADGVEQRSWQVPRRHVDFRGDGGYIVVPPSRVETKGGEVRVYEVIVVAPHEPQPVDAAGLRRFLEPPRVYLAPADAPDRSAGPEHLATWLATQPEGGRNRALFWAACRMVEEGHRIDSALSVLGPAAGTAGLPQAEIERTIQSAYRTATCVVARPERGAAYPTRAAEGVRL